MTRRAAWAFVWPAAITALLGCRDHAAAPPPPPPSPAELAAEARLCGPGTDPIACRRAALQAIETHDDRRALRMSQRLCSENYLLGCKTLGWLYENGRGVTRDPARARSLYGRACEGGEMASCKNLGMLYDTGVGGGVDRRRAASFYARACDANEFEACNNLANLYLGGDGVPRDPERAARLYDRVCAFDRNSRACANARSLRDAGRD